MTKVRLVRELFTRAIRILTPERLKLGSGSDNAPLVFGILTFCLPAVVLAGTIPRYRAIDAEVQKIMTRTHANGMAVAVIDHGKVGYVHAYGIRNAKGDPLTTDTVMYGASLTKTVFAYTVMQLVDQGKLNLDVPIKDDLDNPLPTYGPDPVFPDKHGPYKDLANDPRWEKITPRMCLTHSTGFNNFWFIEPDPEASHSFRAWHTLQLLRRRNDPAAICYRARTQSAGSWTRPRRPDEYEL